MSRIDAQLSAALARHWSLGAVSGVPSVRIVVKNYRPLRQTSPPPVRFKSPPLVYVLTLQPDGLFSGTDKKYTSLSRDRRVSVLTYATPVQFLDHNLQCLRFAPGVSIFFIRRFNPPFAIYRVTLSNRPSPAPHLNRPRLSDPRVYILRISFGVPVG